jgi:hypothetical protein
LATADYPATRGELVVAAAKRGASQGVLNERESLEGDDYESTAAVLEELDEDDADDDDDKLVGI